MARRLYKKKREGEAGIPPTTVSIFALRLSCFGTTGSFCLQAAATAAA